MLLLSPENTKTHRNLLPQTRKKVQQNQNYAYTSLAMMGGMLFVGIPLIAVWCLHNISTLDTPTVRIAMIVGLCFDLLLAAYVFEDWVSYIVRRDYAASHRYIDGSLAYLDHNFCPPEAEDVYRDICGPDGLVETTLNEKQRAFAYRVF